MQTTEEILAERGALYGDYTSHAEITWKLKLVLRDYGFQSLSPDKKETLDMICHKIGRILNGNPDYRDSWDDIAGYAKLTADRCNPNL